MRHSFLLAVLFIFWASAEYDSSKQILVLIENNWVKETHSSFLKFLTDRGYTTTVRTADDPTLTLVKYGEYSYGHIIILAPSVTVFGGSVTVEELVKFMDNGGNLLVTASSDVGSAIRELGSECGIEFDEEDTAVIDHYNYDVKDDGTHSRIVIPPENLIKSPVIVGKDNKLPFAFRGVGISSDSNNPLLFSILHASRTSYSYSMTKPVSDYPNTVGTNTQLIVGLHARNSARAVFIGSIDFLSDQFFNSKVVPFSSGSGASECGNQKLVENLLPWLLGERGQLRVASVSHHRVGESEAPGQYTIMDNVHYSIKIETKNERNVWIPFDADDVQLEFVRIDPFIRRTMKHKNGVYSTDLKLPDVYGVFKFVVDYHRLGYTQLKSVTQVPVRPFMHTQYERFIEGAYPYYVSAISMAVGVVIFSFLFLYYKDDKEKSE